MLTRKMFRCPQMIQLVTASLALLFGTLFFQSSANADVYNTMETRARHVKSKANVLMTEVNNHYRGSLDYQKMIDEVRMLRRSADQMASNAKRRRDLALMSASMTQLDDSFHRLESEWERAHADAARNLGSIRGNTRHVSTLMKEVEGDIHTLGQWVEQLRQAELNRQRMEMYYRAQPTYVPVYQSTYVPVYSNRGPVIYSRGGTRYYGPGRRPNVNVGGSGLSIGNGRFNVRVRF